ncbi:hypothetical protein TREMEDRAFT_66427 [Tremella mesenterica DSM 1558]|uniref:uncharacterized protein n=1 Tax=Tremella mesenterica (strain ATCC 24925 / CBS 8224 / DSM 1558 / NBRC 9311 / NRRL Y-6157 / RJB 2259-6 / UBC 559-6) TaxID=578456 RepID=UPI00032C2350|nr:uncharacterized protein TREMEDRAFT_66427 [Tremella mesenterica DSM 1558]EIW65597.1 hypothetical protein TREMEDRAFT_66427 [Tremella mesenterica DSM 1558]
MVEIGCGDVKHADIIVEQENRIGIVSKGLEDTGYIKRSRQSQKPTVRHELHRTRWMQLPGKVVFVGKDSRYSMRLVKLLWWMVRKKVRRDLREIDSLWSLRFGRESEAMIGISTL